MPNYWRNAPSTFRFASILDPGVILVFVETLFEEINKNMNITYSNVNNIYIINSPLESRFKEYFARMGGTGKTIYTPSQTQFGKKKKTLSGIFFPQLRQEIVGLDLF